MLFRFSGLFDWLEKSRRDRHSDEVGAGVEVDCVCVFIYERWSHKEEVTSCFGKLTDVCKVGVVEDDPDAL